MSNKVKKMEINRENAMRLWEQRYGKETRVNDFAGREMDKGAYDQRGSKYGWNLDHILPKSRGGKDTESNLICCHIATNDEKADKFPCFTANGKRFEIVKVQNHYEIKEVTEGSTEVEKKDLGMRDAKTGLRIYAALDDLFKGTVTITLRNPKSAAIIDFIEKLFDGEGISVKKASDWYYSDDFVVRVGNIDLPTKSSIQKLFEKCLTLNTYLEYYFVPKKLVSKYTIFCEAHTQEKELICIHTPNSYSSDKPMVINELIRLNSGAENNLKEYNNIGRDSLGYNVYPYDYIWSDLKDKLKNK